MLLVSADNLLLEILTLGGVWTVAAFGLRVANRAEKEVTKVVNKEKGVIPSSHGSDVLMGGSPGVLDRANSWMGRDGSQPNDWTRR